MSKKPKKAKDGLYHTQKYIGRFADGSRYYERFEGLVWADVLAEAEQFKRDWNAGLNPQKDRKRNTPRRVHSNEPAAIGGRRPLTLGDAIDRYIETCEATGKSPATIASYTTIRRNSFPALIDRMVQTLTFDDIQGALNERARDHAPKTVKNEKMLLTSVLAIYRPDIDMEKIRTAAVQGRKLTVMSHAQVQEILRVLKDGDAQFYGYVLFGALTGMRPSETFALTWGDLSAEPMVSITGGQKTLYGEINVNKACVKGLYGYEEKGTKTRAGTRVITVGWAFFEELYKVMVRGADDERVFTLKPVYATHKWGDMRKKLGLPEKMRLYDLRHYFASSMFAVDAPEDYIAAAMGHTGTGITHKVYSELIGEKQQQINADMAVHTARMLDAEQGECNTNATEGAEKRVE